MTTKNIFAPAASFKAKCAALNKRTNEIDMELDSILLDLKLVITDTLKKLSRVEKINIIKKVAA
jgi:hypothetical protein